LAAASAARREFARYLHAQAADTAMHWDAELIFGEVVANAVRFARSCVEIKVIRERWAALRVTDDGECFDATKIAPRPPSAEHGRGLYIAKTLARQFDVTCGKDTCTISVTLPVRLLAHSEV
jgi:anti-sigma regulatory factor (Ser/Thr protein kinase)